MCGIFGVIDYDSPAAEEVIKKMVAVQAYRGPDEQSYVRHTSAAASIVMGHQRLAIIDLQGAPKQPVSHDRYTLTYNGEVYNFREVRALLLAKGYTFSSDCDTEVVLKAVDAFGLGAVSKHFSGMFAFALHDKSLEKLYLVRDRSGAKPLYYYVDQTRFAFASDMRTFHCLEHFDKTLSQEALKAYLQFSYIPAPLSIFKQVKQVPPGHTLTFDLKSRRATVEAYWEVANAYRQPKYDISEVEALGLFKRKVLHACQQRTVSDVPFGMFLSGGYDSTLVAALLQAESSTPVRTYTMAFSDAQYDESHYAKAYSERLGTLHTAFHCQSKDFLSMLKLMPEVFTEPFGDSSAIPTLLLYSQVSKAVKVVLSADGGDELLAGYDGYAKLLRYQRIAHSVPSLARKALRYGSHFMDGGSLGGMLQSVCKVKNLPNKMNVLREQLLNVEPVSAALASRTYFTPKEIGGLLAGSAHGESAIVCQAGKWHNAPLMDVMLGLDYSLYLGSDLMTKADRASMHYSVESREPLLDHQLLEFVARLPDCYKIKGGQAKYLMRQLVHQYIPKSLMQQKKLGFSIPLAKWLSEPKAKEYIKYLLSRDIVRQVGAFSPRYVADLERKFIQNDASIVYKLWLVVIFQQWAVRWL